MEIKKIVIFIITNLIFASCMFSQNKETVKLERISLENKRLINILDSLLEKEKKCPYYNDSFIWSFDVIKLEIKDEYIIHVTYGSDADAGNYVEKYSGFFCISGTMFLVTGPVLDKLYDIKDTERVSLKIITDKDKNDTSTMLDKNAVSIEDYSVWIFHYKDGNITLLKAYQLPCN